MHRTLLTSLITASAAITAVATSAGPAMALSTRGHPVGSSASQCALCVVDPRTPGALGADGDARVAVQGTLGVASASPSAVTVSGHAQVSADDAVLAGGTALHGAGTFSLTSPAATGSPSDPLAGENPGAPRGPTTSLKVDGSETFEATAGTYGDIAVGGSGSLVLDPGVYVVTGELTVTGSASVSGSGVTLFVAGRVRIGGSARVSLDGTVDAAGSRLQTDGDATVDVQGVVVAGTVKATGHSALNVEAPPPDTGCSLACPIYPRR